MTQRLWRRMSALLLVLFLLSLIPPQTFVAAQALEDAADRFAQLRANVLGRRSLPLTSAGVTAAPADAPPVDQAARLQQLKARWANEQTHDLARPTLPAPAPRARGFLPLLAGQDTPTTTSAPSATTPIEQVAYRDAHSRTYAYPDGHWETQVYGQPINYQQPDGSWQPYAPSLQPVSTAQTSATAATAFYKSSGTDLDLRFAAPRSGLQLASTEPLVQLRDDTLTLGFTPQGATITRPVVDGATMTYEDAFPNADLRYTATGPGVKEELIFAQPPAADFALGFDVQIQDGSLQQQGQTILVLDAQGKPHWQIDAPFLIDAQGNTSAAVRVELETRGGATTLRYTPDAAWLADPARAYPVTLDPTITPFGAVGDTYVAENPPADLEHYTENALFVGYATAGISPIKGRSRFFINFALPNLPTGVVAADIDSATLSLYQYMDERGGSYQVEIYPTNDPWTETGKRWSTQPGRGARFAIQSVSAGIGRKSFDLTTLVQSWYASGTPANPRGVAFIAVNEYQPAGRFGSRDCVPTPYYCNANGATSDAKPYLSFNYTPVPVGTDEVRVSESLSFTPNNPSNPPLKGTTVTARFKLKNVSSRTIPIPALQVKMRRSATATYDFPQATSIVLAPGQEYTYEQSRSLPESGLYSGDAQFYDGVNWYRVYIAPGSGFVNTRQYLMADTLPPPEKRTQGPSGRNGSSGDPVNTSTGNFASGWVDATLPDVGLSLVFGRTFNSRDTERVGPFGPGWSATYAEQLIRRDDESVVYVRGDGQHVYFQANFREVYREENGRDGTLSYELDGTYRTEDGFDLTLSRAADGSWTLINRELTSHSFSSDGQLQRITDRYGSTITLGYSGDKLASVATATSTCTFGWVGERITTITCPTGTLRYSYDGAGDLIGATNFANETTRYAYDSAHRVIAITDANGRLVVENVYDDQGRVLQQREGITAWTSFSYDTLNRTTTYVDASGHRLTDTYDSRDRLVRRVDELGNADSYSYDADDHLLTHTNALGATWSYAYDAAGNLVSETDPLGATWSYAYNSRNHRIRQTDPLGQTTILTYTGDLLQATQNPLGGTRTFDATPSGLVLRETDELGNTTTRTYAPAGQILSETDPLGVVTRYEYNSTGDQTAIEDALGQRAEYSYDEQHRLLRILDPAGAELRFGYDALGNLISETNQIGHTRALFYDGNNRLIGETDFTGAVTEYIYDSSGNLVRSIDALGHALRYEYDAANRLTARIDQLGSRWSYSYDKVGRLLSETDPLGRVIRHEYDALGREVRTIDARGQAVSLTYDKLGRVLTETDRLGAMTTSTYDPLGRLLTRADGLGHITRYEYDAASRLVRTIDSLGQATVLAYDADARPVQMTDRVGAVTRFGYDALGRRLTVTDPRGATTTTSYDKLDRPVRVVDALGHATTTVYDAAGRRLRETDALGFSRSWTYDAQGRELSATDRTGATTSTVYDQLGRVKNMTDAQGGVQQLAYDEAGRQIAITDALGRTRRTRYDAVGNVVEVIDPRGNTTRSEYDANNNLVLTIDALGHRTRTEYDAADNPVRMIDAFGNISSTSYDLLGRAVTTRDPNGATTSTTYDALGRVVRTTDPRRASTTTSYDAEGRARKTTDALGGTTAITYDVAGLPLTQTDANGNRTRTEYDLLGRAIKTVDALDHAARTEYDALGNAIKQIDPRGATTLMGYDGERRMISRTDALGQTTRTVYDALGREIKQIDPLGNVEASEYDAAGNLVRTIKPGGQTTRTVYDATNNPIARQDARGFVTLTAYDALNRPTSTTDPLGYVTSTSYDALGRTLAQTDANGHALRMSYDPAGRLLSVTDALSQTVRMSYDPAGAVVATLDGNGRRTRSEYDLLGRPVARYDALGNRTRLRYDALGNPVEEQRPNGAMIATRYDALNRPVEARLTPGAVETTQYDALGNVIARSGGDGQQTISYDLLNRPVRATDSANQAVSWRYDAAGRRTHTIYPDNRAVVTGYDRNGWPVALDDGRGHRTTLSYDADGRVLDTVYPASAARAAYDGRGQLLALLNEGANGAFAAYEYTLDRVGNRTNERISTLSFGGLVTLEETAYSYDAVDRLIRSVRSGPASSALDLRYSYDAAGNRTAISGSTGGTSWTERYSYDAADRLVEQSDSRSGTTRYTYDPAGQRLTTTSATTGQRYSYDARGRLLTLTTLDGSGTPTGSVQQYRYDSLGRRILVEQRTPGSVLQSSERTLYDGDSWTVLGQMVAGQAAQWFVAQPQGMGHLSVEAGGTTRFAHSDGMGSYVAYTDAAGKASSQPARYGDWGAIESGATSLTSGYGYTGHRHDRSGLLYANNRLYDPTSATWLTSDPFPAQATQPGGLNRYAYVRGNPITRTDPLGLFDWTTGTIQRGDTLWGIAQAAGTSVDALLALNPQITNPNTLYAGQHLNVGVNSSANHARQHQQSAQSTGTSGARCGSKCGTTYTVRGGDTLSGIAARFGVAWQWIYNQNRSIIGPNANVVVPGQRLYVPCKNPGGGGTTPQPNPGNPGSGGGSNGGTPKHGCGIDRSCPPKTGCGINKSCKPPLIKVYLFAGFDDFKGNNISGLSDINFGPRFDVEKKTWNADVVSSASDAFTRGQKIILVGFSCGGKQAVVTANRLGAAKVSLVVSVDGYCPLLIGSSNPSIRWEAYYQTNNFPSAAVPPWGVGKHGIDASSWIYRVVEKEECHWRFGFPPRVCERKVVEEKVTHTTIDDTQRVKDGVRQHVQSIY